MRLDAAAKSLTNRHLASYGSVVNKFQRAAVSLTLVDDFKENSVRYKRGPRRLVDQLAKTRIVRVLEMSHRGPLSNVNELERRAGLNRAMEFVA